ncbi:hypothetical protein [Prevotella pallens]|uniref:hypothetical protein n=1 Tax=Prevotella pallens TaxID=60133 RepID=UPI0028D525E1|nr:hypothetical protein [Prevotella pallens]
MLGYGRDESAPTPGGLFATHFVGVCGYFTDCLLAFHGVFWVYFVGVRGFFTECSPRYRRPSAAFWQSVSSRRGPIYRACVYLYATHSQSVQNAFTECSQRVRYLCVTYSPCKSMVFALQKYGF